MISDADKAMCLRALIEATKNTTSPSEEVDRDHGDTCVVTSLFFSDKEFVDRTTWTEHGPMWMALWLSEPLIENDIGETLIPRWMAPVLTEYGFTIYDDQLVPI